MAHPRVAYQACDGLLTERSERQIAASVLFLPFQPIPTKDFRIGRRRQWQRSWTCHVSYGSNCALEASITAFDLLVAAKAICSRQVTRLQRTYPQQAPLPFSWIGGHGIVP